MWEPLGHAGGTPVIDALSTVEFTTMSRTPHVPRCTIDVGGRLVDLAWTNRLLVASEADGAGGTGGHALASGGVIVGDGVDSILWYHQLMPMDVLGEPVHVERHRSGRDRWCWQVLGPGDRRWTWRPGGLVLADRMELTRDGDRTPVVTHLLRPVPGRPRPSTEPPSVAWESSASLAEVLLSVMWVLDRAHTGLLPKVQRVARLDFM